MLCFHGAYHGMGLGPLSLTGRVSTKSPLGSLAPNVHFLPYPDAYRQPFGLPGDEAGLGDRAVLSYIQHVLDDSESGVMKPACVILEAIQGEGGVNMISDWALRELRRVTQERGIPLVLDEIQCGLCRSGHVFAFEHAGIVPDVVAISKAVGGGQPLACVVFRQELDRWEPGAHAGTFRGNGLGFAAGAATLRWMRQQRLWEQVAQKGELMAGLLRAASSPHIGSVRGRGLMLGVELVDCSAPPDAGGLRAPCRELAADVQAECFRRGLIIERGGRGDAVLRLLPPLIVSEDQLRRGAEIILASVVAAGARAAKSARQLLCP